MRRSDSTTDWQMKRFPWKMATLDIDLSLSRQRPKMKQPHSTSSGVKLSFHFKLILCLQILRFGTHSVPQTSWGRWSGYPQLSGGSRSGRKRRPTHVLNSTLGAWWKSRCDTSFSCLSALKAHTWVEFRVFSAKEEDSMHVKNWPPMTTFSMEKSVPRF